MTFYSGLKSTADQLLATYAQGTVDIGRTVTIPGEFEWSEPVTSVIWNRINASVKGVSERFIDDTNIVSSDLEVVASIGAYQPRNGDVMRIDGAPATILRIDKIPGAGLTVAWRFIVRGGVAD